MFSENGRGSEFIISIPITEPINENITLTSLTNIKEDIRLDTSSAKKTILLIEDNTEFRDYMRSELSLIYDVYDTDTGETGVELAREMNPDVIISDVMLPGISGIEVCCIVKNDIAISHIPVILMTADCSIATMAKGYKEGADHYITKPFVFDILLSNIRNLMIQNNNRHRNFADEQIISPEKLTISLRDEKFIEKVIELIEANMSNSEYSIEKMSGDMAMSRMNFFRKMRALTGMSPVEFVSNMRLKKAASLLLESDMTIVEIGYAVGFNSPSYFTKSFKKAYGVIPTMFKTQSIRDKI